MLRDEYLAVAGELNGRCVVVDEREEPNRADVGYLDTLGRAVPRTAWSRVAEYVCDLGADDLAALLTCLDDSFGDDPAAALAALAASSERLASMSALLVEAAGTAGSSARSAPLPAQARQIGSAARASVHRDLAPSLHHVTALRFLAGALDADSAQVDP